MRIRNIIQTAPLVLGHSWWSARRWLACASSGSEEFRRLNLSSLEDRVLFDAMPLVVAVAEVEPAVEVNRGEAGGDEAIGSGETGGGAGITITDIATVSSESVWAELSQLGTDSEETRSDEAGAGSQLQRLELVFVDAGVDDVETLLADLRRDDAARRLEVVLLESDVDGVLTITDTLAAFEGVDAIHVISHGSGGGVRLGNTWLTESSFSNYAPAIAGWGASLTEGADILFYGCDLASTEHGRTLLESLSVLTMADVAASLDDTGHQDLGGDWDLEFVIGSVESHIAVSEAGQESWQGLLQNAVFQQGVNGYTGTVDTYIQSTKPDVSDAAHPDMHIMGVEDEIGLLRFDNLFGDGVGQIPLGSTINSVTLTITTKTNISSGTASFHRMLTAWDNNTTWNSLVGGVQRDDVEALSAADVTLVDPPTQAAYDLTGANLTATVQAWADGQANFGWAIFLDSTEQLKIQGSESPDQPRLSIDYTAPPIELKSTGEQRVNVTVANAQETSMVERGSRDAVTILPNGDSVFAWSSQNQDGSGWGIYTQRYNSKGLAISAESRVNLTTANDQRYASIASDSSGNYVITWTSEAQDGAGKGVFARVFYADGTASTEFRVNQTTAGDQWNSSAAMDDLGHIIFVWEGNGTQAGQTDGNGAFVRRFNLDTTAVGGEQRVNVATTFGQNQVAVAATPDGRFVVTYDDDIGVSARRYASNGTARDASMIVVQNEITAGEADVAIDDAGNFTVVWRTTNQGDGSLRAVMLSRYSDSGTLLQGPTVVSDVSANLQTNPSIAMLGTGEFIVVWEGAGPGDTDGVFVRKFSANGTPLTAETRVNPTVSGSQKMASVAMVDLNNFTVVWTGNGTGDGSGVFMRQYGTQGIPGASFILSTTDNVTNSGVSGLSNWTSGTILRLGDPGLQLGENTTGVLQQFGNGDNIPVDGAINIDGFHFVTTPMTLANGQVLLAGDVLYSANDDELYPGVDGLGNPVQIPVRNEYILRFRPLATGDYTVGEVAVVYANLGGSADPFLNGMSDINGLSLIERDTVVAGVTLMAGDMLFTRSDDGGGHAKNVYVYHALTNTASKLINGADLGITGEIADIDLIETSVEVGGMTLASGTVLITLTANEASLGTTGLSATGNDVVAVQLSQSSMTGQPTIALATIAVDGSDIAFDSSAERINALSLVSLNAGPKGVNDSYTVTAGEEFESSVDAWFDTDWSARQRISFDNSTRAENLTDFPVLVVLDSSRIDYSRVHGNGDDLRFVDPDGTVLAYEIESWDPNGRSYIWVKVPKIDANSVSDSIWMYYDNNLGVAAGENPAGVWSNSYEAVYHFDDSTTATGTAIDSTGRGIDGTNVGTTQASGVVGSARSFNGVNQYIDLGNNLALVEGANAVTLSAWVQTSTANVDQNVIAVSVNSAVPSTSSRASLVIDGTELHGIGRSTDTEAEIGSVSTGAGVTTSVWKQVSVVIDYANDSMKYYVDGQLVSSQATSFSANATSLTPSTTATLGAQDDGTSPTFGGLMDEVRIAVAARSAAWLSAEFASSTDTLTRFGGLQLVAGVLENDFDPEGLPLTATNLNTSVLQGSVTLNSDGSFVYDDQGLFAGLTAGQSATTQFSYSARDSEGALSDAVVTLLIQGTNDAPVLASGVDLTLASVLETDTNPAGDTVFNLLANVGDPITDVDAGAVEGIAVYEVNDIGGQWEYSLNGTSWTAFGAVTDQSAVVLDTAATIRFVPNNSHSAHDSQLRFRAWDQTDSLASGTTGVDIREHGGITAYSENAGKLLVDVIRVNHEPTAVADNYTINEDTTLNTHPGDWLDVNWPARRRLTFDNSSRTETLVDFPVLVELDSSRIDYSIMKGDGTDLRFTDANGNLLAYEIDVWNPAGESYVWVKVPTIAAGTADASIWMYYGNTAAASGENATGVWSNGYEAVYHLEEDPVASGGTFDESTGRLVDATNISSVNAAGYIGQGQQFNLGTAIDLGDNLPLLQGVSGATISAWINPDTVSGNQVVIGIADNVALFPDLSKFSIEILNGRIQVIGMDSDDSLFSYAQVDSPSAVLVAGEWQLVSATLNYAAGEIDIYLNGVNVGHFTGQFNRPTSDTVDVDRAAIGAEDGGSGSHFDGLIDDVQVSGVTRSASWIAAQYANQTGQFISFSGELNQAGVLDNDVDLEGDTLGAFLNTMPSHALSFTFNGSGSFTYTPEENFVGTDSFTYYVYDGDENSNVVTVTITVNGVNDVPTTSGITDVTVNEDADNSVINLWGSFADVETADNQLTFSIVGNTNTSLFTSVTPNNTTGELTLDYAPNQFGTSDITVRATDAGGLFVETTFRVTVNSVNDTPTTSGIADVTVDEDAVNTVINLWDSFADVETADNQLTFTIVGNTNTSLFTSVTRNNTTGELTLDYAPNQFGTSDITVRATDAGGLFVESTFRVTVNSVNDVPTTSGIAAVTVNEDTPNTSVNLWDAFADIEDIDSQLTFTVVGNTNSGLFSTVTPNNSAGTLTLNYAANQFGTSDITIRATDTGGLFVETTFRVTVNSVNDTPTTSGIANVTVDEDATNTFIGLRDSFADIETPDSLLSFSIVGNTNPSLFTSVTRNNTTGELTLDYAPNQFGTSDITIRATDAGGLFVESTFRVTVNSVNDTPTTSGIADVTVDEDAVNTVINLWDSFADIETADNQLTFTIVGNTNTSLFTSVTRNNTTGELTIDYAPNQFGTSDITVRATDAGGLFVESTFRVTVNSVNDTPTTSGIANVTVDEDAPASSVNLRSAFADLEDSDSQLTLTVVGNTNTALFSSVTPSNSTGTLTLNYAPNQFGTSDITIRATDTGGLFVETTFQVTVNAVNDAPTISTIPSQTITEDGTTGALAFVVNDLETTTGSLVVSATSSDGTLIPNENLILSGSGSSRTIEVIPAANLHGGPVTIVVTVSDGQLTSQTQFTVTVLPVNDAPTLVVNNGPAVAKGGSVVLLNTQLQVADIDTAAGDLLYTVATNSGGGFLERTAAPGTAITSFTQADIDAGNIRYVHLGGTASLESLGLSLSDGTSSLSITFELTIDNVRPTAAPAGPYFVTEGSTITLDASDSFDTDGTITLYEWDFNYNGTAFNVDATGAHPLFDATLLDGPLVRTVALRVTDDNGAVSMVVTTVVNVVNVAPTATADSGTGFTTNEETPLTTSNVLLNDTDPGAADLLSVTSIDLTGTIGTVINHGDGTFTYDPQGKFESLAVGQTAVDHFTYTINDGDGGTSSATVTITIEGRNDRPLASDSTFTVSEAATVGTALGSIVASDVDAGDTLSFSIVNGNTNNAFQLNATTGLLTVADASQLDFETTPNYTLVVQVLDANGLSSTATVTISVTDANESPQVSDVSFSIPENSANGALVGVVTASDVDAFETFTWTIISGNDDGAFVLDPTSGELRVLDNSLLDFEQQSQWVLQVEVADASGLKATANVTINLTNVNETPTTTGLPDVTVDEDAPAISVDLAAAFINPETGSASGLTFVVTDVSSTGLFESKSINPTTGLLTLTLSPDKSGDSTVTIRATNAGGAFVETSFLVTVIAVNDQPIVQSLSLTVDGGTSLSSTIPGVLLGATDIEGANLTAVLVQAPANGSLTLLADGSFVYRPKTGYSGTDSFKFAANDGETQSLPGVVHIDVLNPAVGVLPKNGADNTSSGTTNVPATGTDTVNAASSADSASTAVPDNLGGKSSGSQSRSDDDVAPLPVKNEEDDFFDSSLMNRDDDDDLLGLLTRRQQDEIFSSRPAGGVTGSGSSFGTSLGGLDAGQFVGSTASLSAVPHWMTEYRTTLQFVGQPGKLWDELDNLQYQAQEKFGVETVVVGSAATAAGSVTVGYVLWTLRSGVLLSSLLAQMPAWRLMDPLTILENMNMDDDEDDESLASLVDQEDADPAVVPDPLSEKRSC
ncbi:MAG: DUF2341 domain-containing protein [Planctomycetaceae bacterium]